VLATIYNDKAILENHHCATVFKIAKNQESNIFEGLDNDQHKLV